jgi:myo-inositol catabolism protein IolS
VKYRKLGKSTYEVSEVGLGAWPLGGRTLIGGKPITYGEVSEEEGIRIIERAIELGVNLIDTADSYGLGRSERLIGRAIKGKREKVFIATKACWIPDKEKVFIRDVSYHNLIATCERSLRRLGIDCIDLFQVHDGPRDEEEVAIFQRVFEELKKSGKAKLCGASIAYAYEEGIRLIKAGVTDTLQLYYNMLDQDAARELLPLCEEKGVGVLVAIPLAQGLLTGKYQKDTRFRDDDIRSRTQKDYSKKADRVESLRFLDRPGEQTMAQAALRFCLAHPAVSVVIPGARTVQQLEANVSSSGAELPGEDLEKVCQLFGGKMGGKSA